MYRLHRLSIRELCSHCSDRYYPLCFAMAVFAKVKCAVETKSNFMLTFWWRDWVSDRNWLKHEAKLKLFSACVASVIRIVSLHRLRSRDVTCKCQDLFPYGGRIFPISLPARRSKQLTWFRRKRPMPQLVSIGMQSWDHLRQYSSSSATSCCTLSEIFTQ